MSEEDGKQRIIAAADANEVMLEQLQYLIEHAGTGTCGCPQCGRYLRARALLTEIFSEASFFAQNVHAPGLRHAEGETALEASGK
jgi:hypothetical protein